MACCESPNGFVTVPIRGGQVPGPLIGLSSAAWLRVTLSVDLVLPVFTVVRRGCDRSVIGAGAARPRELGLWRPAAMRSGVPEAVLIITRGLKANGSCSTAFGNFLVGDGRF